jgi:poly-gamma-glutamate capsule biosynthesis protein CapA/YwtB (metallophosphatase superfamily)
MTNADFVVLNLETPITDCKHSPFEGEKDYIHWTDKEKAPKTLIDHNVSLVSLANNHTFDYGIEGYNQTLSILKEHNLPVIGCGNNIYEASDPFICEINFENKKKTIAIIAAFEDLNSYRKKYKVYADIEKPGLMPLDINLIADRVEKIKAFDESYLIKFAPYINFTLKCKGKG